MGLINHPLVFGHEDEDSVSLVELLDIYSSTDVGLQKRANGEHISHPKDIHTGLVGAQLALRQYL